MIRRARAPGLSVRVKLAVSYAAFLMVAGALLLAVVWVFLLRYVPTGAITGPGPFIPNRGDLERAFTPAAAWALLFLLAFGLVGGWLLAGRMLAPLQRITEATRLAASGSLSHRIDLAGRQDEFRELADSFDAMLERLQAQVEEQQRFAANASHELRTPLAITQTMLDVARNDPGHDTRALIERLRIVNARAISLTEALLVLSRAEQRSFTAEEVDLSLLAEEATETLLPLAEARGVELQTSGSVARTAGSPTLLLQLVTNLVHNAIVHNLPTGGAVLITTEQTPRGTAALTVDNTGGPMSPELVATLAEPFQRGSERARGDDHAGVGLGLAIVKTIAETHAGTIAIRPRAGGGLHVRVELPAPQR
ncbi:sensor histidine kinase [Microbacterium timonense]|uniref:sensor histidine kinase n=1 Tax=Microbacterium timonense TaxID=2086576 RepID=UPI000D0FDF2B|nr:HAMP domain-containing sensor histidine kinase [Microbacterium timonense]